MAMDRLRAIETAYRRLVALAEDETALRELRESMSKATDRP